MCKFSKRRERKRESKKKKRNNTSDDREKEWEMIKMASTLNFISLLLRTVGLCEGRAGRPIKNYDFLK